MLMAFDMKVAVYCKNLQEVRGRMLGIVMCEHLGDLE